MKRAEVSGWSGSPVGLDRFFGRRQLGYQHEGGELLVNTTTSGNQVEPVITRLASGGFVILWLDISGTGHGQVFDAAGNKVGSEFLATGYSVAALPNGGFVATWTDSTLGTDGSGDAVNAQMFDAAGAPLGSAFVVNTQASGNQNSPSVAVLASGDFVITWDDARLASSGITDVRGQRFTSAGVRIGTEFAVRTPNPGFQNDSEVAGLAGGGFVVTWTDGAIKAQLYDAAGVKVGADFVVSTETGSRLEPQIAALESGGFVVVWTRGIGNGFFFGEDRVYAQVYTAAGAPVGANILIAQDGPAQVLSLDVAGLAGGGFAVTWAATSGGDSDTSGTAIKAQVFDDAGAKLGAELIVNTTTAADQIEPVIAGLATGEFVISWVDESQTGGDTSGFAIRAQLFHAVAPIAGTGGDETLNGTPFPDEMFGLGGNDILQGAGSGDVLDGGAGNDLVRGEAGDDILKVSGLGADQAEGGSGLDTLVVNYADSPTGIVTAAGPSANAGLGGFDGAYQDSSGRQIVYSSIERFEITGGAAADSITTADGDDLIVGGGGDDVIAAGNGRDTIRISGAGHSNVQGGGPVSDSSTDTLSVDWSDLAGGVDLAAPTNDGGGTFSGSFGNGGDRSVDFQGIERFVVATGSGNDIVRFMPYDLSLGAGDDMLIAGQVYGESIADGGAGEDGVTVSIGGTIVWNLQTNFYSGPGRFTNFEYFGTLTITDVLPASITTSGLARDETIIGGGGNDIVTVVNGHDSFDGGAGNDLLVVNYSAATSSVTTLGGAAGIAVGTGGSGSKGQIGDGGARNVSFDNVDTFSITTGSGNDTIFTGSGADVVRTGDGSDSIATGSGNDALDGGAGADTMTGGLGNDVYIVDDAGDVVIELAGEGTDEIRTDLAGYSLLALPNVERLTVLTPASTVNHDFRGNAANNVFTMGAGNDFLRLQDGGNDTANGAAGNDVFLFGATLTSADIVNGGTGADQIAIQGDYSGGLTLGTGIVSVESFAILPGSDVRFGDTAGNFYSYGLTTVDANVAAGVTMVVDANRLRVGENFTFNGSAETDGAFFIYGGGGADTLTGGRGNDAFYFGEGGQFGATDHVDGGPAGIDQLGLRGNYTIVFGATQLVSIESIGMVSAKDTRFGPLGTDNNYNLTMNDGNLAAGVQMTIDAAPLRPTETLTFNGGAELDGTFRIFGGAGNDNIAGGHGNDIITGGQGADSLTGGAGNDVFLYRSVADSTSTSGDTIQDFTTGDRIDLSRIDADTDAAGDQAFAFIGSDAFTNHAGELRATNVGNVWTVQGDVNGDGVADIQFTVNVADGPAHQLAGGDFIL
jgi:Ca2+-binding RTX toxin-like protein